MKSGLAIITARGGSKRIPRKNIRHFLGQPILLYSIQAALQSGLFEEVMVSTEDEEIAEVARQAGATVPFFRSAANSDDYAATADVLREVLETYQQQGRTFETACCLYPTAPFVTADKLIQARQLLEESAADTVLTVTPFSFPIWRGFRKDAGQRVSYLWPENAPKRSQDLEPTFHDVGQFYYFRVPPFLASGKLIGPNSLGLEVSELEVQDIDNETDWQIAEIKFQTLQRSKC
jgi:pseudaminic acid cytidylyltransferase